MSSLTSGDSPPPDIGLSVSPVQTRREDGVVQSVIECQYSPAQQDRHAPPPSPARQVRLCPPGPGPGSVVSVISALITLISANTGFEYKPLEVELDRSLSFSSPN